MSHFISWAAGALLAGLLPTTLLLAQEPSNKADETKPAEPAPAIAKYVPPANIQLDTAKTLRLAKLLENLYVLNELNVSDEAYASLQDVKQQERVASRRFSDELRKESTATRNLPLAERTERSRMFFPAHQARRDAALEGFAFQRFQLLTGVQMERLVQVDFQDQGLDVFLEDDVIKGLKLTADERKKLGEIYDTYVAKIKPLLRFGAYREAYAVRSTKPEVAALVKERAAKVDELLGKERAEKLAERRGKTFDVSRLEMTIDSLPNRDQLTPHPSARLLEMVRYQEVRKDLGLTPDEEAAIAAAKAKAEKTGDEFQRGEKVVPENEMSAVQRALWIQEAGGSRMQKSLQIQQDYQAELLIILKDSHLKRLEQINLQKNWRSLRGAGALQGVPSELGVTSDQSAKMRSIEEDIRRQKTELTRTRFDGNGGIQVFFAKQNERRKELTKQEESQLLEVLTPEQRQKLKELQGPPFDVSIFDPLASTIYVRDPLETKFDQSVIDYVNGTLLREQDANEDGFIDKSEWVKGKWSVTNPPENSDLNKDGKLSREELCIRVSKSRGIPIKGEPPAK